MVVKTHQKFKFRASRSIFTGLELMKPLADPVRPKIPQTVLALWGSGVFKAGEPGSRFPASRTFPDTANH